jgi:hypothetical protein
LKKAWRLHPPGPKEHRLKSEKEVEAIRKLKKGGTVQGASYGISPR